VHELAARIDVYDGGVSKLQRHVYMKHTKFQNADKFYRVRVKNLKCRPMYVHVK